MVRKQLKNEANKIDFDLVLMDLQMPVMDGMTATTLIREKLNAEELPIIALSADVMVETVRKIKIIGMQDHVAKPIDFTLLLKAIIRVLTGQEWDVEHETVATDNPEINELMDQLEGFDVADALKRMSGNVKLYHKILNSFAESYSEFDKDMRSAIARLEMNLS